MKVTIQLLKKLQNNTNKQCYISRVLPNKDAKIYKYNTVYLIVHVVDILSLILTGPLNEMFDNMICFCIIKSIIVNFKKMNELPG